jgi:hypothetical protein
MKEKAGAPEDQEPPLLTVGELKIELNRWPDHAAMNFRCPLRDQEFRFYRIQSPAEGIVEIELNEYPETPPVIPGPPKKGNN